MSKFTNTNMKNKNQYGGITTNEKTNMHTMSDHNPSSAMIDDTIYGGRHSYKQPKNKLGMLNNKTKNTMSGQLSKKKFG